MNKKCLEIYKYPLYLLFFSVVLTSCHQKLVPRLTSVQVPSSPDIRQADTIVHKPLITGIPLVMDGQDYALENALSRLPISDAYFRQLVEEKVKTFYLLNNFQTKWLEKYSANENLQALIQLLQDSYSYGLRPEDYHLDKIQEQINNVYASNDPLEKSVCNLDVYITGVWFLFTSHVTEGRITNPGNGGKIWLHTTQKISIADEVNLLLAATSGKHLASVVSALQPQHEQYLKLQAALSQYRQLAKAYTEQQPVSFAANTKIKPNESHPIVPHVRKKIAATDLKADSTMMDSARYDEALVSAVKWFQVRHGLEPDGILGAATLKFINQSFEQKAEIIALNLERLRWERRVYSDNFIVVNIPEYTLRVYDEDKEQLAMKVIVGAEGTATPVFTDTLRYIVFSPTWAVPTSIIRNEIIPILARDSAHYAGKNYSFYKNGNSFDPSSESWDGDENAYAYNVVQQPGPSNALGLVKFVMPNNMNIYLHDTPNHRLFSKSYRALSHGCVRLDDPDKLAQHLLQSQRGWDKESIEKAMHSNQTQSVILKKSYAVHLEYRTAWVDKDGLVNFREDIYGHDRRQLAQLKVKEEQPMVSAN